MFSATRFLMVAVLAVAVVPGCALTSKLAKKKEKPVAAARATVVQKIGTISLVNSGEGFVLIDNGSLPSPAMGSTAESRGADGSVAHLKITEIRKRPFSIADIMDGTPARGDAVFQERVESGAKPTAEAPAP